MARVTRIERQTEPEPVTNGHYPEWAETRRPIALPDFPEADVTAKIPIPIGAAPQRRAALGDAWRIFGAVVVCLAVTLLLNTKSFVKVAEEQPDGPGRAILLPTAHGLDNVASAVRLDHLSGWIDTAIGRKDEAP